MEAPASQRSNPFSIDSILTSDRHDAPEDVTDRKTEVTSPTLQTSQSASPTSQTSPQTVSPVASQVTTTSVSVTPPPRKSLVYPHNAMYMAGIQHHPHSEHLMNSFYGLPLRLMSPDVYTRSLNFGSFRNLSAANFPPTNIQQTNFASEARLPPSPKRSPSPNASPRMTPNHNSRTIQDDDDALVDVESVTSPCPVMSDTESHDEVMERTALSSPSDHQTGKYHFVRKLKKIPLSLC